jgi:hypothetical protein
MVYGLEAFCGEVKGVLQINQENVRTVVQWR